MKHFLQNVIHCQCQCASTMQTDHNEAASILHDRFLFLLMVCYSPTLSHPVHSRMHACVCSQMCCRELEYERH